MSRNATESSSLPQLAGEAAEAGSPNKEEICGPFKISFILLFCTIKHNGDFINLAGNCKLIKEPCYKDNKKRKVIKDRLGLGSGLRPSFPQLDGDPRFINSVNGVDDHQFVLSYSCSFSTFWDISAHRGCLAKASRKSIQHEALPCRLQHTCHPFIRSVNDPLMEEPDRTWPVSIHPFT